MQLCAEVFSTRWCNVMGFSDRRSAMIHVLLIDVHLLLALMDWCVTLSTNYSCQGGEVEWRWYHLFSLMNTAHLAIITKTWGIIRICLCAGKSGEEDLNDFPPTHSFFSRFWHPKGKLHTNASIPFLLFILHVIFPRNLFCKSKKGERTWNVMIFIWTQPLSHLQVRLH